MAQMQRTMIAAQAVGLADYFKFLVGNKHKLSTGHVAELSAPEGESTEGGKQALQHIKLVAQQGGATIVIGHVNTVDKKAEINTCGRTQGILSARFGNAELIDQKEYAGLVTAMQALFTERGLVVVMLEDRPVPVAVYQDVSVAAKGGMKRTWIIVGVATAVIVVAVAAMRFF